MPGHCNDFAMKEENRKIELLAPAGYFEKLEIAIHYGADAVYLAGKDFSLRNFSGNFTIDDMEKAVRTAHHYNVKVYAACNVYSRNNEQNQIAEYLETLARINVDAVIIADPGVFFMANRIIPNVSLHLSTQANTTNSSSVRFWKDLGIKRVNTARELSIDEIREIAAVSSVEIEAFIHGAMCISYSGRCLLSSFMANRDSNRGMCSHPCRWKYSVVEEMRPDKYMPVKEDERGTYIFNSYDLCMIEHIPELIEAGINSLKIEGRMKGINYLASTVKTYRSAIDSYYSNPLEYKIKEEWIGELNSITNRGYCTGFYFMDPEQIIPNFHNIKPKIGRRFAGKVIKATHSHHTRVEIRNKLFKDDIVEILSPNRPVLKDKVIEIIDGNLRPLDFAQPGSIVSLVLGHDCMTNDLIRRIEKI